MSVLHRYRVTAATGPEPALAEAIASFETTAAMAQYVAVDFELDQYWLAGSPSLSVTAVYRLIHGGATTAVAATVVRRDAAFEAWWAADATAFAVTSAAQAWFDLEQPIPLQPVVIPKPWGQEIWYTGIEKRGVARVALAGRSLPLPWLLAAAPARLLGGRERSPILLKILDPLPEPVFGDLYFELHREKREVYVVTDIDRRAWPDGVGGIRYGFSADLRARYADDRQFLAAYRAAVSAYREIRIAIDQRLDANRAAAGIDADAPVDPEMLRRWLGGLPAGLQQQELELRAAMDRFTGLMPLRVGDVVKIPCYVPHALQHGVRTVEFQTPVYERLILSFAQKVLTQGHWDTEEATALLQIDAPAPEPLEPLSSDAGWHLERVVRFDDFDVLRVTLAPGGRCRLPAQRDYALAISVGDGLLLSGVELTAEQALLLPATWTGAELVNSTAAQRHLLLARPLG